MNRASSAYYGEDDPPASVHATCCVPRQVCLVTSSVPYPLSGQFIFIYVLNSAHLLDGPDPFTRQRARLLDELSSIIDGRGVEYMWDRAVCSTNKLRSYDSRNNLAALVPR